VLRRTKLKPGDKPLQRHTELRSSSSLKRTGAKKPHKASASTMPAKATKAPRYTGPTTKMRNAVLARDDYTCQRCARDIRNCPYSLQHRLPRGRGGKNTMANLVTMCGSATTPGMCHDHVENRERAQARIDGWLVPSDINPEEWPVRRFGHEEYQMPGETGWTPAERHPLQAEMELAA
jgi:5-methylcytosine-specific restriction endonuclease McrA